MDSFTVSHFRYTGTCCNEFVEKIANASKHLIPIYITNADSLHDIFILVIHKNGG
ncbi:hypothetical protein IFVP5_C290435 [Vibrio parahaemolyticus]